MNKIAKLRMAAKAANFPVGNHIDGVSLTHGGAKWDPLECNSDAFELQAALGMNVFIDHDNNRVTANVGSVKVVKELKSSQEVRSSQQARKVITDLACLIGLSKSIDPKLLSSIISGTGLPADKILSVIYMWETK